MNITVNWLIRFEQLVSGLRIFGVAIRAQVTRNLLEDLLKPTSPEIMNKIYFE